MDDKTSLLIQFDWEIWRSKNTDGRPDLMIGTGFDLKNDRAKVQIKGKVDKGDVWSRGRELMLYGKWVTHPKHGRQFDFSSYGSIMPVSSRGVLSYLRQSPGLGEVTCAKLVDRYGVEAIKRLIEDPDGVARAIGVRSLRAAADHLAGVQASQELEVRMHDLLSRRGFPRSLVRRVMDTWGASAPERITNNPFSLCRFSGVGFLLADQLYLDLQHDPAAPVRQAYCVWQALLKRTGDTWADVSHAREALREGLSGVQWDLEHALKCGVQEGVLELAEHDGKRLVAVRERADAERQLAKEIERLLRRGEILPSSAVDSIVGRLEPHQIQETRRALRCPIAVLHGSPGTGKSWSASFLIGALMDAGLTVRVCAPTGKAGLRVSSLIENNIHREVRASTVHRLLRVKESGEGGWQFHHDDRTPLTGDVFVVDESSMLTVDLALWLFRAIPDHATVILIGDPNQLPPVGHGFVYRDLIDVLTPYGVVGCLTEVRRNSGAIVEACRSIRETGTFQWPDKFELPLHNLYLMHSGSAGLAAMRMRGFIENKLLKNDRGLDPIRDCQVLCAINEGSPLSRKSLNDMLQLLLNPHGEQASGRWRIGDKLINTENQRIEQDGREIEVMNGDLAYVLERDGEKVLVQLDSTGEELWINGPGHYGQHAGTSAGPWDLGYAITCHKFQGSECPIILIAFDPSFGARMVMDRSWVFTALSRGKQATIGFGSRETVALALARDSMRDRVTMLPLYLNEVLPEISSRFASASGTVTVSL